MRRRLVAEFGAASLFRIDSEDTSAAASDASAAVATVKPAASAAGVAAASDMWDVLDHPAADTDCPVCMDGVKRSDAVQLPCKHVFCVACLRDHVRARMREGAASIIMCPAAAPACEEGDDTPMAGRSGAAPASAESHLHACASGGAGSGAGDVSSECHYALTQRELRALLGQEAYAVLDRRALEHAVAIDPTLHICPTPDCTYIVSWTGPDDGLPRIDCPLCHKDRCLVCGACPYHEGRGCIRPALRPVLQPVVVAPPASSAAATTSSSAAPTAAPSLPVAASGAAGGAGAGGASTSARSATGGGGGSGSGSGGGWATGLLSLIGLGPPKHVPTPADALGAEDTLSPEERATREFLAKSNIKLCKRCGNGVVKEVGCHKLKCRCGFRFCWMCDSENAQCACTPALHGFWDNSTNRGDFSQLSQHKSPT